MVGDQAVKARVVCFSLFAGKGVEESGNPFVGVVSGDEMILHDVVVFANSVREMTLYGIMVRNENNLASVLSD